VEVYLKFMIFEHESFVKCCSIEPCIQNVFAILADRNRSIVT